jgi:integrase
LFISFAFGIECGWSQAMSSFDSIRDRVRSITGRVRAPPSKASGPAKAAKAEKSVKKSAAAPKQAGSSAKNSLQGSVSSLLTNDSWNNPAAGKDMIEELKQIDPGLAKRLSSEVGAAYATAQSEGTTGTYASAVRSLCAGFTSAELDKLLPVSSPAQWVALFAKRRGQQWSTTRSYMAAISQWHLLNNVGSFETARYSPEFSLFYKGLKRSSINDSKAKRAVDIKEVEKLVKDLTKKDKKGTYTTQASLRDAAVTCLAFFWVKRISECIGVRRSDITKKKDGLDVCIRHQKQGGSTSCFVPFFKEGKAGSCPATIITEWIDLFDKKSSGDNGEAFLFPVTKGKKRGQGMSAQQFRSMINQHFASDKLVSTHSLRKGGGQYWISLGACRGTVQTQGGWKTTESMDKVYLALSGAKTKSKLAKLAQGK